MAGKKARANLRRAIAALTLENTLGPVNLQNLTSNMASMNKKRNQRKRKNKNGRVKRSVAANMSARMPRNAPVAMGLKGRRSGRVGIFAPVPQTTSDLLDVVVLGSQALKIAYQVPLGPQNLPDNSRAKVMASLYAKYRPCSVEIRIESAVPTSSGGQYAAFFDPNPTHVWTNGAAIGALTSMPVKQIGAAWECLTLKVPPAELEYDFELFTAQSDNEKLVTNFGQLVLLTMAPPSTTGSGTAQVTVWLDVVWEFYEPNTAPPNPGNYVNIAAGTWTVIAGGNISVTPDRVPNFTNNTAYTIYPALPVTFLSAETSFLALSSDGVLFAFDTEANAQRYALEGGSVGKLTPGTTPSQALPASVCIPIENDISRRLTKNSYKAFP
jgi:hypothetical protein